ncbi:hypothetical protein BLA29_003469 [Euroglyphus maynei]|uniref:Uncharacterized protein n=1 Tax=Euroglyphus maynei TaxID=6958 RepID=A0A1Y3BTT7_EURMA|nr:hypothetical protein BLA29_003469 [Euroglyphus maynei]
MQVPLDRPDPSMRLHHSPIGARRLFVQQQQPHHSMGMNGRRSSTSSNESHQTSSSSCSLPDHRSSSTAMNDGHFAIPDRNNNIKGLVNNVPMASRMTKTPIPSVRRQQPQKQPIAIVGDKTKTMPSSRIPTPIRNMGNKSALTAGHKTKSTSMCSLLSGASRIPTSSLSVDHRKFLTNYSSHNINVAKSTIQAKIQSRYVGSQRLNKSTVDLSASRSLSNQHDSSSHSFGSTKVPNSPQTPVTGQYRRNSSQAIMSASLPRTRSTATIAHRQSSQPNSKKHSITDLHSSGKKQHGGSVTSLNSAGSTGSSTGSLNEHQSQRSPSKTNSVAMNSSKTTTCPLVQVCSWIERNH